MLISNHPNSEPEIAVGKRVAELERELFSTTDEIRMAEIIAELRRLAPEEYGID
jgi:hypothetical protein